MREETEVINSAVTQSERLKKRASENWNSRERKESDTHKSFV